jgi:hypothetical protein
MRFTAFALSYGWLAATTTAMVMHHEAINGTEVTGYTMTHFGWPDNSPPGAGIAYQCKHRPFKAGGTGTYDNPITIATAKGELEVCGIYYVPKYHKYMIFEDDCEQCEKDWNNGRKLHFDVWTGGNKPEDNGGEDQINCEGLLTPGTDSVTLIKNPPPNKPVDRMLDLLLLHIHVLLTTDILQPHRFMIKSAIRPA